jgi:hypothetical protein
MAKLAPRLLNNLAALNSPAPASRAREQSREPATDRAKLFIFLISSLAKRRLL